VNPINEPFSIEREKKEGKYMVFNISCNSEVETKWESDKTLLVSLKVPSSESGFSVYSGRRINLSGRSAITIVVIWGRLQ
jgi:hypothetical protein